VKTPTLHTLLLAAALATMLPAAVTLEGDTPAAGGAVAADNPAAPAIDAFNKGRAFEAVRLAEPLANAGNPEALLIMALAHESGRGAEPSRDKAIEFYRKSHQAGNQESAYRLARLLVDTGKEPAQKEALSILEELAKSDTGIASRILGEGALRGWFGGEADFEKTRFWWANSAAKGDITSMLALGRLLDGNFGFPDKRDPAAALEQFVKAAKLGNPAAMVAAGSRLLNGDEAIRNEKSGREWLEKPQGKPVRRLPRPRRLRGGRQENDEAALEHYRKGAENGQAGCMIKLATFLLEGRGGAERIPRKPSAGSRRPARQATHSATSRPPPSCSRVRTRRKPSKATPTCSPPPRQAWPMSRTRSACSTSPNASASATPPPPPPGSTAPPPAGSHRPPTTSPPSTNRASACPPTPAWPANSTPAPPMPATPRPPPPRPPPRPRHRHRPRPAKAWALFSLAIERGDEDAKAPLGDLTSQLTPEQITKGREHLAEFKKPPAPAAPADDKDQPDKAATDDAPAADGAAGTKVTPAEPPAAKGGAPKGGKKK
jgi:uncharacterized protein